MRVVLKLEYRTHGDQMITARCGEDIYILNRCDGEDNLITSFKVPDNESIRYNYCVMDGEQRVRDEWRGSHSIPLESNIESLFVFDRWSSTPSNTSLYSSLFTESIFRRQSPSSGAKLESGALMIEIDIPCVTPDQRVVLVGSSEALGSWSVADGVEMLDCDYPTWRSPALEICGDLLDSDFKFVIVDNKSEEIVAWEEGSNRSLTRCRGVVEDAIYIVEHEPHFDLPEWRGAGVAIPLFSLRSEQSMGVGDFADLKKMVDWACATGQKIIQILPINDTTMTNTKEDSYPYNANSIFALHPQYISLKAIGELSNKDLQREFEEEGQHLNQLPTVDYSAVNSLKNSYLRELYRERRERDLKSHDYEIFFTNNSYWLESYALFSLLRDRYSTPDFTLWGDDATYSEELLSRYKSECSEELGYYYFVQYHLHIQLLDAHAYARAHGVAFKGDIPIGVSRTSVDVWVNPELFRVNSQAGAPPDDFSVLGQNWGFPTYNWEAMALDGYGWWQARFSKMAEYFDAYRIDHILGFFRIWEIPLDAVHGLLGHFNPALPLTAEEMQRSYGFTFERSYIEPAINDWLLDHMFKERAEEVKESFFLPTDDGTYRFRTEYNTQVKVAEAIEELPLRDALLSLFTEVLFIEDTDKAGHYHPRISAQSSFKYRAMSDLDKERYDRLYTDFYYHRHNDYWRDEALKKLPVLISATDMLTCGEDLGMIPESVPYVMDREQILSLEIQRMPKDPRLEFGEPWNYPYRSVCTTSTHDMNPLRAWLREDRAISNRYFKECLGVDYTMAEDCDGYHCELILRQHLSSPSMLVILPLQDWLSMDERLRAKDPDSERINIPANPRHYWRYRMHCTIEELLTQREFNNKIAELLRDR